MIIGQKIKMIIIRIKIKIIIRIMIMIIRIDNGMAFSARDNDQDRWSGNCSSTRGNGGW